MTGRLDGKVVVVTGAASRGKGVGTGKAIAILSAREGARVALVNRSADRAEALKREIESDGGEAMVFAGDMTKADDTEAMAAAVEARFGGIDALANNIGGNVGGAGSVTDLEEADWDATVTLNLKTAMLASRACLPALRRSGGAIVNISSTVGAMGLVSHRGAAAYASAKAGMHGLTRSLAADYAADGVRANCIVVGTIYTPMVAHQGPEARERRKNAVPLRSEGLGWDIAWGFVYLASEEARWITGALLPIDGGFLNVRDWPR